MQTILAPMEQGDEGFKRGVSALTRKRGEILSDIAECRKNGSHKTKNDLEAVERCLGINGPDVASFRLKRSESSKKGRAVQLYYRNELRTFITKRKPLPLIDPANGGCALRTAGTPKTTLLAIY